MFSRRRSWRNDKILGGPRYDLIFGDNGHDTIDGGDGDDGLYGGPGNDTILGGRGNDRIKGGEGNDTLTGGEGEDTFFFEKKSGHDVITDFSPTEDKLHFRYAGTHDNLLHRAVQKGNDIIITFDKENTLTLKNVELSSITPGGVIWDRPSDGGGDNNDRLYGWFGDDTLDGGDGNDPIILSEDMIPSPTVSSFLDTVLP